MRGLDRIGLGQQGENLACQALTRLGYEILARHVRTRYGEIDIVALDGRVVVFVEVKTRRSLRFGHPSEAVTHAKQRRLRRLALDYLSERAWVTRPARFDVVAVTLDEDRAAAVEVLSNAFEVAGD